MQLNPEIFPPTLVRLAGGIRLQGLEGSRKELGSWWSLCKHLCEGKLREWRAGGSPVLGEQGGESASAPILRPTGCTKRPVSIQDGRGGSEGVEHRLG